MNTDILAPFLNRDGGFDPAGWFQLVPKGTFPIKRKEGDKTVIYDQVVDDEAVKRIVAAFTNRQENDPGFRALIDYEHFSHDTKQSSEAAAWINRMEARADGVWAQAEWTPEGEAAVKAKRYRFLSPVWLPSQVEKLGPRRVRPVAVNDAGLTNKPNLGEALQPFWNRADDASLSGHSASENQNQHTHMKEQLIALFGLAATAPDAEILAKAGAFLNRAREADALQVKFDSLTSEHAAYKNRHDSLLKVSVERALEEHKDVITAESQDAWKNRLTSDFEGTSALLAGIKRTEPKKPVHDAGKGAASAAKKELGGNEEGDPFMNRVKAVRIERKIDEADAIAAVAGEEPALYAAYREQLLGDD